MKFTKVTLLLLTAALISPAINAKNLQATKKEKVTTQIASTKPVTRAQKIAQVLKTAIYTGGLTTAAFWLYGTAERNSTAALTMATKPYVTTTAGETLIKLYGSKVLFPIISVAGMWAYYRFIGGGLTPNEETEDVADVGIQPTLPDSEDQKAHAVAAA